MKKEFFVMLLILVSLSVRAQDLILLKDGTKIQCQITNEDTLNLYFRVIEKNNQAESYINRDLVTYYYYDYYSRKKALGDVIDYRYCASVGLLMGGGSIVGMDLEYYLANRFGLQLGAGIFGFGGGVNLHFKPRIRSSYLSLQYWHQGIQTIYTQSLLGPSYVFRGKRWLTAQIGLGFLVQEGPAWPSSREHFPVMLTYALGAYFPW